jgi:hypothetical protein
MDTTSLTLSVPSRLQNAMSVAGPKGYFASAPFGSGNGAEVLPAFFSVAHDHCPNFGQ